MSRSTGCGGGCSAVGGGTEGGSEGGSDTVGGRGTAVAFSGGSGTGTGNVAGSATASPGDTVISSVSMSRGGGAERQECQHTPSTVKPGMCSTTEARRAGASAD